MKRTAALLPAAFAITAITAGGAGSATSKSSFAVSVAPTITAASNGFTIDTALEGSFNVAGKTASGSGSFAIMNGATVLESGTFTLAGRGPRAGSELGRDRVGALHRADDAAARLVE